MAARTVILFGGGDDGGVVITDNGVIVLPPFNPDTRNTLKSASTMLRAARDASNESMRGRMNKIAQSLSNLGVELVEEVVGQLTDGVGLIYQDDEDGFYCGSTGKPPIPLPWPPTSFASVADLIAGGAIQSDIVRLIKDAKDRGVALTKVFDAPNELAKQLGVELSAKSAESLTLLSPSKSSSVKNPTDREIIQFFYSVVQDGNHLTTWFKQPANVANILKVSLSDSAIGRLLNGGASSAIFGGGSPVEDDGSTAIAAGIAWAGVCIVIGIVCGDQELPIEEIITDRSLVEKF